MKAILDMTRIPQIPSTQDPLHMPCFLLPIQGKPFLQHSIEYIEKLGVKQLYVYLFDHAQEVENLIGDGERWGLEVTYFLIKEQKDLLPRIGRADYASADEIVLFGNGLVLPMITKELLGQEEEIGFTDTDGNCLQWAVVKKGRISKFDLISAQPESPLAHKEPTLFLAVRNGSEYIESMKCALDKQFKGLIVIGHERRNGFWLGPGVKLPKTTTIVPPVYINEQTQIGDHNSIGPYVEIGKGCVIDENSFITESVICDHGYVGKQLDIKRSVIHKNQIFNTEVNTIYNATDEIFLSHIESSDSKRVPLFSKFVALLLYILCLPIHVVLTLAHLIKHGVGFKKIEVVKLPQKMRQDDNYETMVIRRYKNRRELEGRLIKHLLFVLIPGLSSIITGKMRFCGLQPRSLEEVSHMNDEWKELYLASSLGLISESEILYRNKQEEEMLYASDIFYSVNDTLLYNIKLVGKYIVRLFVDRNRM